MNVDVMILCVYLVRALGFTYCLASHIAQVVSQDTREQSQAVAHHQTHAQTSQRYTRCCADREGGKDIRLAHSDATGRCRYYQRWRSLTAAAGAAP